jgi:hypothetical protein
VILAGISLSAAAGLVYAVVPREPTPEPTYRQPRPGYVRQWHIFNDSQTDGILDPGDTYVETFSNWWTPVSSHSQATYRDHQNWGPGYDYASAPMNWATYTLDPDDSNRNNPDYNYWLPRQQNALHFYMTYSQFDNNDWATTNYGNTAQAQQIVRQRNLERNGWALGWVANDYNYQQPQGAPKALNLDIFIHRGELATDIVDWGVSRSNPHVGLSNDVDLTTARDTVGADGGLHPAEFDESTQTYSWSLNRLRLEANGFLTEAQLATLVGSMEVKESDPYNLIAAALSARTPAAILAGGPKAHDGSNYLYEDAVLARHLYPDASTDGGAVSGLGGYSQYDPQQGNWADQQVIRIDIDPAMLLERNITEIVFYDFGFSDPGSTASGQVQPQPLIFRADDLGRLYFDGPAGPVFFPENRIYIAMVDQIPEPATLALLCLGAGIGFIRRSRV